MLLVLNQFIHFVLSLDGNIQRVETPARSRRTREFYSIISAPCPRRNIAFAERVHRVLLKELVPRAGRCSRSNKIIASSRGRKKCATLPGEGGLRCLMFHKLKVCTIAKHSGHLSFKIRRTKPVTATKIPVANPFGSKYFCKKKMEHLDEIFYNECENESYNYFGISLRTKQISFGTLFE